MNQNIADAIRLWSWLISGLAVSVISIVCAQMLSVKYTSITTQLVGSLLTLFGLLFAYLRASHRGDTVREQLRALGLRLIGRREIEVHSAQASGTMNIRGYAYGEVDLQDWPELPVQEQIDKMADYIRNHVMGNFRQVFDRLEKLKSDVEQAHTAAADKSAEAYNKAKAELDQLRRELEQRQVLDLRWAIFGIYIATIGVALSYLA
jgi:hypothetical protein